MLAATIAVGCGADPALRADRLEVRTVDAPAPVLHARWRDEKVQRWVAGVTFVSVAKWSQMSAFRWIAAVHERIVVLERTEPQPTRSVGPRGPAIAEPGAGRWDALAQCESGGRWDLNSGNGFFGGIQFSLTSWRAVGGSGYPNDASREEQIARGQALLELQGPGAWPVCSYRAGLR